MRWLLLLFPFALSACASLETRAPLVDGTSAGLANGREIYIGKCAACHGVRAIDKYSIAEWEVWLPQMQLLAEADPKEEPLSSSELAAVRSYIHAFARR